MAEQEIISVREKTRRLYSALFVSFMRVAFFVVSFFDEKARRGLRGRKDLFAKLAKDLSTVPDERRIWFHASSLGEFEQAKPIIEKLKASGYSIVASFFSPSGYEYSKNYPLADVITYIPFDTRTNAVRFIDLVKPRAVVVMRYDLWMNHLIAAKEAGARIILADATFPVKLIHRAKFLKDFFRELYGLADEILVTGPEHKKMFDFFLGREKSMVVGDTRFDRVYQKSLSNEVSQKFPVEIDKAKRTVLVLGSTWRQDIDIVTPGIKRLLTRFSQLTVLIVPHEPEKEEVSELRSAFPAAAVLSEIEQKNRDDHKIVIVDRIGLLTQLYVLADVAYVGGGFGSGVHSVLEPAVYGVPIITGPRIEKSDEALQLHKNGALFFVRNQAEAYRILLKMMEFTDVRRKAGRVAGDYVGGNLGASSTVARRVELAFDGKNS